MNTTARGRKNGDARGALRARSNDVLDDVSELRKDMGRLAEAASKAARAEVKHAGHRLEQIGKDMRTRANDSAGYVVEKVRERPGAALGISLGTGLLLGLLLARR
ncbi:MAG: glycine zipper domain-containing protein [Caulobacteraceae bacterium]